MNNVFNVEFNDYLKAVFSDKLKTEFDDKLDDKLNEELLNYELIYRFINDHDEMMKDMMNL